MKLDLLFLGTPAQLLLCKYATSQTRGSNLMHVSESLVKVKLSTRMEMKGDLGDWFELVVGIFSEIAD